MATKRKTTTTGAEGAIELKDGNGATYGANGSARPRNGAKARTSGNGHGHPSREEVAERAYQLYERAGRRDGSDLEHWLQAEAELISRRSS